MAVAASKMKRMMKKKKVEWFLFSASWLADGIKISRKLFNEIQTNGDQLNENLFDMDGSEQLYCFGLELGEESWIFWKSI